MQLHRRVLSNLEVGCHGRAYGRAGLTQGWVVGGTMRWWEPPIAGGGGGMRGMGREHDCRSLHYVNFHVICKSESFPIQSQNDS